MQKLRFIFIIFCFVFAFASCHTSYQSQSVKYKKYQITKAENADNNLSALIKPYADSVNKSMNDVIGYADITLERKMPESTLGNLMADMMKEIAEKHYNMKVDVAVMNIGGIRLNSIAAGAITRGKIFELSPFDNIVVLQKLTGKQLQSFLDHTASKGGWPVAGVAMQIKNKQAANVKVNNVSIDVNATYTLAVLDYVANGGDDAAMLRTIPQINNGYLYRDGIIEFIRTHKNISAKIENRVTNAE